MSLIASTEPWLMVTCLDVGLVGYSLVKWLEVVRAPTASSPVRWIPVGDRWDGGFLIAAGLLGLVWPYAIVPS